MAYSKKVVDKFENTLKNPEKFNVGKFDPKDGDVGTGMVGAPACGDVMKLQIKCKQEGNQHIIEDVKFKTYGCGSAIASSAELVEMLIGKTLDEAKEIKNKDLAEVLELHARDMNISLNIPMKNKREIFYLMNHPLRSMLTAIVLNS